VRTILKLLGLVALGVAALGAPAGAQRLDTHAFIAKMKQVINARQGRIETSGILNAMPLSKESYLVAGDARTRCYFDFGDVERFAGLVAKGLGGAVVDPGYLDGSGHAGALAIYQNVNWLTLVGTRYEAKYNGFIVLRGFNPRVGSHAEDTTQLHEAIHALAFGIDRLDLDVDGRGADAPEYISNSFFSEQHSLLRLEQKALREVLAIQKQLLAALEGIDMDKDEARASRVIRQHVERIYFAAKAYLKGVERLHMKATVLADHSWRNVHDLMAIWGGKADWDGLLRDTRKNVALLRKLAVAVGKGNAGSDEAGDAFTRFFFKKRCIPE